MKEDGIDIIHHTSNHVNEYLNIPFDYIITVCDHARENCSPLAGEPNKLETHWPCDILLLYLAHSPLAGEPNKLEKNWKKIGKKEKIKPNFPACDFL